MSTPETAPQHLHKLVLNITHPLKMDTTIELNKLVVLVGANGSGKTLMLKIAYALSAIGASKDAPYTRPASAQFVFDNVFGPDHKFNGTLKGLYTRGSVSVELEDGKVKSVDIDDLLEPMMMIFMSSDMRTFDNMNLYLRVRKGAATRDNPQEFMAELLEAYRLYDVTYMESLIARCPIMLPDVIKEAIKVYEFEDPIASISVDEENCKFIAIMEDGRLKPIASYGKGHQAILNMMIGAATSHK